MEVDPAAVNILEENVIDNAAINQVDLQLVVFQDQISPVAVRKHDAVNLDNFSSLDWECKILSWPIMMLIIMLMPLKMECF